MTERPIAILTPGTPAFSALKWVGTITGVVGAFILALNIPFSGWGWTLFLISSVTWTFAGAVMKDVSLVVLQFAFVLVDVIGIWRWLLV